MRLAPLLVSCLLGVAAALPAPAADVILKDGQSIATSKPYVVKGKMAVLTRLDGSLVSIPADEIDLPKTAEAALPKPAAPEAAPSPEVVKAPKTPAEAAKVKGAKRASVVLTDAEVARGTGPGPEGEKQEKGDGEVSIGSVTADRTKTGYSIVGSVIDSGKGEVRGVGVRIEMVGENGKVLQTVFGNVAKDNLAPGEKSAFTAEVVTDVDAKTFRYIPSWQVAVPVKAADPAAASKADGAAPAAAKAAPPPEKNPVPGSAPRSDKWDDREPKPVPRPDVAPPAASGSVGAPVTPGGAYVPRPSDNQAGSPRIP